MRPLWTFLAVTGLFVAINLVAAAVMLAGGKITLLVIPNARELVWPFFLVGAAGLAAAILFARLAITVIPRWLAARRARARD